MQCLGVAPWEIGMPPGDAACRARGSLKRSPWNPRINVSLNRPNRAFTGRAHQSWSSKCRRRRRVPLPHFSPVQHSEIQQGRCSKEAQWKPTPPRPHKYKMSFARRGTAIMNMRFLTTLFCRLPAATMTTGENLQTVNACIFATAPNKMQKRMGCDANRLVEHGHHHGGVRYCEPDSQVRGHD